MRIIIHAGVWKTGSTAIQTFLAKNAEELARRGVMIPAYAQDMSQYNLFFEKLVGGDEEGLHDILASIRQDVAELRPSVLLISSEHFWHAPEHSIRRLADLLREISGDIVVRAYVRPQDDMWASLYAQQAKFFRVRSDHAIWGDGGYIGSAIADHALFYHRCFDVYRNAFGAGSVELRAYDRKRFVDGDAVQDFLSWIGLEDRSGLTPAKRDENASFGWKGVAFSIWLADRLHRGETRFADARVAGKALRFAMRDTGEKFNDISWYGAAPECFGPEERARIRAHYAEDNAALFNDYFGGEAAFRPPSDRPRDPLDPAAIPEQEFAFAAARLRRRIARTHPLWSAARWRPAPI